MLRGLFLFSLFVLCVLAAATWPNYASTTAEEGYSMPTMAPDFGPPPFEYKDAWTMMILFKTTPEVIRDLMPKPLFPNPEN